MDVNIADTTEPQDDVTNSLWYCKLQCDEMIYCSFSCMHAYACPSAISMIVALGLLPPVNQTQTPSQGYFTNERRALAAVVPFVIGLIRQGTGARRPVQTCLAPSDVSA